MSTLDSAANHHESDSEDDQDYVPGGEEQDSDTSDTEGRDAKRPRVEGPPPTQEDLATAKSERQALWAKFQESITTPAPSTIVPEGEPGKRMVKIVKRHRFAGEDVVEIVDVPEDSADAKKWPLWKPPEGQNEAATPHESGSGTPTLSIEETSSAAAAAAVAASSSPPSSSVPSMQTQPLTTTTTTKRPSRRKPKLQLAELPSVGSRKGKKLTTLEKSALDWKAHVDAPGEPELASELEANRRGGGYLEKVEFLERVGDRKVEAFEANKDHKRHRR